MSSQKEYVISNSLRKAKPIFQEEKEFIEKHLEGITIPPDCWITGGGTKYVWLDLYSTKYYIKFQVESNGEWKLIKDNRESLKSYEQTSIADTLELEKDRVIAQYDDCIKKTVDFVNNHRDVKYTISISGGKDSETIRNVWEEVLQCLDFTPNYEYLFFNTTNECASVYKYIKSHPEIKIVNPDISWRNWIKKQNYFLPSIHARNCCTKYKEGQARKQNDTSKPIIQVLGVRNKESIKRAKYEFYMDYDFDIALFGSSNLPKLWSKLCPIVDFETVDIWLLMMIKDWYISDRYKFGETRVGCLICPFSNSYENEILKERYPLSYQWLVNAIEKNYYYYYYYSNKVNDISLQEWIDEGWKHPVSKVSQILQYKPTPERIHQLATLKGISDEMASKFWIRKCTCGKIISPIAAAMFYKTYGRYEGMEDNRIPLCINCYCREHNMKHDEFYKVALEFKEGGCNLF